MSILEKYEFVSPEIEQIQDEIAQQKGYKIIKHVHQLFVKNMMKNTNIYNFVKTA